MKASRRGRRLLGVLVPLGLACAAAAQTPPLVVVSWNLEWLADPAALKDSGFWARCKARGFPEETVVDGLPPCSAVARYGRTAAAYELRKLGPMRQRLAELAAEGMDVLVVQEVGSPAALRAVLPTGWRVACFSQTPQAQNIGFAVREAAGVEWACRQIDALSLPPAGSAIGRYRPGLELVARVGGPSGPMLAMLNVHLKASCATSDMTSLGNADAARHCRTLQRQVPVLEAWIERQAKEGSAFMIVGDWNRDLEREIRQGRPARTGGADPAEAPVVKWIRNLWPEISDGAPAGSAMGLASLDRKPGMAAGCHATLDHVAVSQRLIDTLHPSSLDANRPQGVLLGGPGVSDHCPLWLALRW